MTALLDTSVLIDYLRGDRAAARILETERASAPLHASEITRLEVLAGMRPTADTATRRLLGTLTWHPVDAVVAERTGDLTIAATADLIGAPLLTSDGQRSAFPITARMTNACRVVRRVSRRRSRGRPRW